jgi:putative two-component system response regulator
MSQTDTILVVDDEKNIRDLLSILLSEEGYQILDASDGQEALELASTFSVSSILLDARMPGLDGFEVANILKNNPDTNSIPIIMVTALNDIPNRVKALESGVDDFLSKPVDRTELIATVKSQVKVKPITITMRNHSGIWSLQ